MTYLERKLKKEKLKMFSPYLKHWMLLIYFSKKTNQIQKRLLDNLKELPITNIEIKEYNYNYNVLDMGNTVYDFEIYVDIFSTSCTKPFLTHCKKLLKSELEDKFKDYKVIFDTNDEFEYWSAEDINSKNIRDVIKCLRFENEYFKNKGDDINE